jgi:OmpA-OmpF porin, OOP family
MKFYFLISFLLLQHILPAQNLIKNPGFEEVECAKAPGKAGLSVKNTKGEFCRVKDWDNATQAKVPLVLSDTAHQAKSGSYCAGLNVYGFGNRNVREYLIGNLARPLTEGKTYIFRMNVKLSPRSTHVVTSIGAYFTADKVNMATSQALSFRPQVTCRMEAKNYLVSNTTIKGYQDLVSWTGDNTLVVEGSFVAFGGEKYIVIGNFESEKTVSSQQLPFYKAAQKTHSYYLVDELSLEEDNSMPLTLIKKPLFQKKDLKVGSVLSLKDVNFDQNKTYLSEKAGETLYKLADLLKENPRMEIEIQGHNDVTGKETPQVAEERAQTVMRFLLLNGVDRKRLTPKGLGTDKPLSFYFTSREQARNRRVEIRILKM